MWLLLFFTLDYGNPVTIKDYALLPYALHSKAECEEHVRQTKALNPNGKFTPICFEVTK